MPVFDHAKLWGDVLDPRLDEFQAPELDYLVRDDPRFTIYRDPDAFFNRTLVTRRILDLLRGMASALRGESGESTESTRRVYVLYSFFGGGKTHTLFTVYHAFRKPSALMRAVEKSARTMHAEEAVAFREEGKKVVNELEKLGRVEIILVSGKLESLFPSPARPQMVNGISVQTLWGYIAAKLGKYDLVADEDRSVRVPAIDRLVRVLDGAKAIILMDEILEGIKTYAESGSEADRSYASQIVTFIDNLLSAAVQSNVVVVITLPGEKAENDVKLESRYEASSIRSYAEGILRAIRRVAAETLEPVASGEFWKIILQRLFEYIDKEYADQLSIELRNTYEDLSNLFGADAAKVADKVKLTYPLHPLFPEVLRIIIERNRSLQKTRDAIKISRIIARKLYKKHSRREMIEDMIMPWHIDPLDGSISALILKGYDRYKAVVDKDLKSVIEEKFPADKREFARIIATNIFLKSYVYDVVQIHGEAVRFYPTKSEIALMTYDPSLFQERNWLPSDIDSTLEELRRTLHYLWSDGEKYWFWYVANVNEIVERRMMELYRASGPQLLQELTRNDYFLEGLVERMYDYRYRRLGKEYARKLFEDVRVYVSVHPGDVEDDGKYKLIVAWEPRGSSFEDIVTHYFRGGKRVPRNYRNTVVVVAPSDTSLKERAILEYARIKAVEDVQKRLNDDFDLGRIDPRIKKSIFDIQKRLVSYIKDDSTARLHELLLNGFDTIYYPAGSKVERRDVSKLGVTAMNLTEKVESALNIEQKAILDSRGVSIDYILEKINVAGVDLSAPTELNEIIYRLRIDPSVPMIPRSVVEEVLSRAVAESKLVALTPSGDVVFPRIVEGVSSCPERITPPSLKLGKEYKLVKAASSAAVDLILNYLKSRQSEEILPDGRVLVREAVVKLDKDTLSLEEFEDVARESPEVMEEAILCIREEVRERGIKVRIAPENVKLQQGASADVKVKVVPLGLQGSGSAKILVETHPGVEARLSMGEVNVGGEAVLTIKAKRPGTYTITVGAETPEGFSDYSTITVYVEGLEKVVKCEEADALKDYIITELKIKGKWEAIDVLLEDIVKMFPGRSRATVAALDEKEGVELRLTRSREADVAIELVKAFARSLRELLGSKPVVEVVASFEFSGGIPVSSFANVLWRAKSLECTLKVKPPR